jgi:hypothetical protein
MGWKFWVGLSHNPFGVEESFRTLQPRVALRIATLGFEPESLWDSQRRAEPRGGLIGCGVQREFNSDLGGRGEECGLGLHFRGSNG